MKKVAIFGNAGGGKSALARKLAEVTRLPLHVVDMMQFRAGGIAVPHEQYVKAHAALLRSDAWIIDGFGGAKCAWERFAAADTHLHRSAIVDALPLGDEASDEGPLCRPARLALGQPGAEQLDQQLSCALALSSALDAEISRTRVRGSAAQARSSPQIRGGDRRFPKRSYARGSTCVTRRDVKPPRRRRGV